MSSGSLIEGDYEHQNNYNYDYEHQNNYNLNIYHDDDDYYISHTVESPPCRDAACIFLTTVLVIIFVLGVAGNAVVIWVTGFKVKKSVNTTWYLSLAVSNFLSCCTLPFEVVKLVREDWIFGLFMCKFIPFVMFLNMFSSVFILVIISVDHCITDRFPVWGQNQRTIRKASVIVTLVWIISAALSTPSLIFRDMYPDYGGKRQFCFSEYNHAQDYTAVVACQIVFGYLIPFVIIICNSIIMKINQSARFKKPLKIMTALIVTFFICWLPFHTFAFMYLNYGKYELRTLLVAYIVGITLSSANHCVNPFIYAFMGRDAKIKWYGFPSKIENALVEEDEDQNAV